MTGSAKFIPLCLALALAAAPLLAQTAPQPAEPPAAPAAGEQKKTPPPATPAQGDTAKKGSSAGSGKDSPFDYRASEQISEDLPVAFPVDI